MSLVTLALLLKRRNLPPTNLNLGQTAHVTDLSKGTERPTHIDTLQAHTVHTQTTPTEQGRRGQARNSRTLYTCAPKPACGAVDQQARTSGRNRHPCDLKGIPATVSVSVCMCTHSSQAARAAASTPSASTPPRTAASLLPAARRTGRISRRRLSRRPSLRAGLRVEPKQSLLIAVAAVGGRRRTCRLHHLLLRVVLRGGWLKRGGWLLRVVLKVLHALARLPLRLQRREAEHLLQLGLFVPRRS